ncbi:MAG: hypothetical protein K8T89_16480, partial [Planctomycetes bacterium]|nr:hypothetical protein [Planctomycetota bacterium]
MKALLLRFNRLLPKIWLFSIYGATGGLLGALLFGELLFAALTPRKVEKKGPPLQIGVSSAVSVYQGGSNRFPIKIARDSGFIGPVTIKTTSPGIQATELTI